MVNRKEAVPKLRRHLAKGSKTRLAIDLQRLWTLFSELYNAGMAKSRYPDQRIASGQVFGYIEDTGLTLTELAERAGMSKQAMSELVDRLVSSGYLKRVPNPHDRRAKLLLTTDKGERQIETSRRVVRTIEAHWARILGEKRLKQFRDALRALSKGTFNDAKVLLRYKHTSVRQ
jgi:DNA-binding MarR family transcriptional regulator